MPNYGRSGRCLTCKRRRVKCDEARPACSPCRRLGLNCGGYNKNYAFKDENFRFTAQGLRKSVNEQNALVQHSTGVGEPSRSLLTGADVAIPFFLLNYASMGRSLAVGRGFYETLIPVYTSQCHNSPLSLAISAVAAGIYSFWRHEDAAQEESHTAPYCQAVVSLRSALDHPDERAKPATALAVLVLHLYESLHAVYNARPARPVHHQGALSLLPVAALDGLDGVIGTHVKAFVLHTEISSAVRQKRSMHPNAYSYATSPHSSSLVPGSFSSTLDSIGALVAELQADYVHQLPHLHSSGTLLEQQCRAWIAQAEQINDLLQAWARDVPDDWRPVRLTSVQDFSLSIAAYQSACEIYPSCLIATFWNLWRFHRLLLLQMTASATQHIPVLRDEPSVEECESAGSIQELVDGICYSVPFCLGNRAGQSCLSDFANPDISFPSYHSLAPGDSRHRDWKSTPLSKDEHHRHMVAYGAWHLLSPLSNLLTLVSDDHGGRFVARCLRPGQLQWIREQFLRTCTLLRLPAARAFSEQKGRISSPLPSADDAAETLAKQVRKGARFMSGP
ncbi:hypothetical protein M409DRAFT_54489 [Zasmidium cellare ATCC 36951]|uniref:Zn(2)-C6 fungal-type domain-containing protein n=1 Tax=Zasmidium cellare ATCC 36951 TaxID=1080233 RepID=A0A6A6CJA8_ZASCE|nr:uncharacterized protein M409DRAFT_54489 [Zasmidium cellare ATCC 36951]KAF2166693.1 hypothetical protein M409DRAFT_54489 [Zasmidium cellare ATCC 36951]